MKTKSIVLTVSLVFLMSASAHAGVPEEITFMGRLVKSGSPVTSPTNITFQLFLNSTGGSSVWSETQIVTPNGQGVYMAYLGSALNPLPTGNDTLWIQVTVVSTPLNPRRKLTSTPFALRADTSDNVGTLPNLDVTGDVTIDGNVGIGTTSGAKLSIGGGGKYTYINPGQLSLFYDSWRRLNISTDTQDKFQIRALDYDGNPTATLILDAGSVGIGTTSPSSILQIGDGSAEGGKKYLQIDSSGSAPPASDCDSGAEAGRMIWSHDLNRLYICDPSDGWRYVGM